MESSAKVTVNDCNKGVKNARIRDKKMNNRMSEITYLRFNCEGWQKKCITYARTNTVLVRIMQKSSAFSQLYKQ